VFGTKISSTYRPARRTSVLPSDGRVLAASSNHFGRWTMRLLPPQHCLTALEVHCGQRQMSSAMTHSGHAEQATHGFANDREENL
jgi:hypothetical protein